MEVMHPNYENCCHRPESLRKVVLWLMNIVKNTDRNVIWASGVSGVVVGSALSYATGLPLSIVRKKEDASDHYEKSKQGPTHLLRPLIVDDLVASGKTMRRIIKAINPTARRDIVIALYHDGADPSWILKHIAAPSDAKIRVCAEVIDGEGGDDSE